MSGNSKSDFSPGCAITLVLIVVVLCTTAYKIAELFAQ
jgi:hypothetical protein